MFSIRGDGKEDIAYVTNAGSGYFIQEVKIVGFNGENIGIILSEREIGAMRVKAGKLEVDGDTLYLRGLGSDFTIRWNATKGSYDSQQI